MSVKFPNFMQNPEFRKNLSLGRFMSLAPGVNNSEKNNSLMKCFFSPTGLEETPAPSFIKLSTLVKLLTQYCRKFIKQFQIGMGAFLDKPKTDKFNEHGEGNGLRYAVSSMQGWRIEMEDAHCAHVGLSHGLKDWSFFAVFDGHAGSKVSAHCAENLLHAIDNAEPFKSLKENQCPSTESVVSGIREGFLSLDENMKQLAEIKSGEDKSGSTAVCAIVSPTHIFFGNCGDSRGILSRDRKIFFSTQDHKPVNPIEKERIQKAGGSVMIQRVNGSLAVSRALGDYEYKQVEGKGPCEQLVSPEPEVFVQERDFEKDEFLILACDGVWDVMSNEDVCEYVHSRLALTDNLESVCNQLVDTCLYKVKIKYLYV